MNDNDELRSISPKDNYKEINALLDKELDEKEKVILSSMNRLKNPFKMVTIEYVMNDLNICRNVAYKLFQKDDFPSINIGKNKQVMLVSYIIWKMNKRGW